MAEQDAPRWDLLVPWSRAAEAMGVTSEQLREWHERYSVPAVTTPAVIMITLVCGEISLIRFWISTPSMSGRQTSSRVPRPRPPR